MAKPQIQSNPRTNQVFDDLEKFRDFCVEYGYRFDEAFLYNMRNYAYQQYSKYTAHKNFKDQWESDQKRFDQQI